MARTYQQSQSQVKTDVPRNSHRKPHQLFSRALRCQPWKFGKGADGRKYRIHQLRLAQLAVVLSRFDYSGDCRHIYAGVPAILKALIAYVVTRPADEQFGWSRKTIFRYLKRLEAAGIMHRGGYSGYRTRRRRLDPQALLREPIRRESDTSGGGESDTSATANLTLKKSKANTSRGGSGGLDGEGSNDPPEGGTQGGRGRRRSIKPDDNHYDAACEPRNSGANAQKQQHPPSPLERGATSTPNQQQQKLPEALRSWMRVRILQRSPGVTNRHSYVRAAEPEFLENLSAEIEEFLSEKAEAYLDKRINGQPNVVVMWSEIFPVLTREADIHRLPFDEALLIRAVRSASELLGLEEKREPIQ